MAINALTSASIGKYLVMCIRLSALATLLLAAYINYMSSLSSTHMARAPATSLRNNSNWAYLTPQNISRLNKTKLILIYTTFYGKVFNARKHWEAGQSERASGLQCEWSNNKSLYNYSHAVVFHLYNNRNQKDFVFSHLPPRHNPNQTWALMIQEPQTFYYPDQLKLLNGLFNLTITFQSDSDITVPYGRRKQSTTGVSNSRHSMAGRKKLILWLVSNCVTSSRRERYVKELQKYINVDIYGNCDELAGSKKHVRRAEYEQILSSNYKFYLAFENADCDDYITEKFWTTLRLGMIPIVRGHRAQYQRLAPPNSYIHADSFLTAEALALYLKEVAVNATLFNPYHKWRESYIVQFKPNRRRWMNELCREVHNPNAQTIDVYKHFSEDTRCFTYLDQEGRNRSGEHMENLNHI